MRLSAAVILICMLVPGGALAQQQGLAETPQIAISIPSDPALANISVVVREGLASMAKLPDPALRQARADMLAGQDISIENLRALADFNDGLAAQKLVQRLQAAGGNNASDIAYYGSIAVSTGRVQSLRPAVAAMRTLDPATEPAERLRVYAAMLYPHAWAGNPLALDAVMDLNGIGKLFGPLSEATRAKIEEQGRKSNDGRVALRFAINLLNTPNVSPEDTARATAYLTEAANADHFGIKTTATNLLAMLAARQAAVAE